ncbi:Mo25-like protein [Aduncisulcus paluster]|uniref:Mo25-like protein n=1 Tax=Aduncisulcus paluster TaxID=2918883 RepID=A0ABQ5JX96_9EUKA|nr:Mo25-like protein [Aduncisulcus paluster]
MGFFRKSPVEIVKKLSKNIPLLAAESRIDSREADKKKIDTLKQLVSTDIEKLKTILYGSPSSLPNEQEIKEAVCASYDEDLIRLIIVNFRILPFETQKSSSHIITNLIRKNRDGTQATDSSCPAVSYFKSNPSILKYLFDGYKDSSIIVSCGLMLRELIRLRDVCKMVLNSHLIYDVLFKQLLSDNFDVASESFTLLKHILLRFRILTSEFLSREYDIFFKNYNTLLLEGNFVIKRQALKLLSEILIEPRNGDVRDRYIGVDENLKLIMVFLKDKSAAIRNEAFHVFKVFVANPRKTTEVVNILKRNKDKVITFLKEFEVEKEYDSFKKEKQILLKSIRDIDKVH